MKKIYLYIVLLLNACVTMSGTYHIYAVDASGNPINNKVQLIAEGSRIYSVRNALCANYPDAKIIIKDTKTGRELEGESGYQCRH